MKRIFLFVLPIAAIAIMALRPINDPLPIGASLPKSDLKMKSITGKDVSFKDAMKANGLLVMFSCNTCPIVHKYESRTVEICKKALDNNIGVILLNPNEAYREKGDSYSDMKAYAEKLGYTWNYVLDNNSVMADEFGATRTPEVYLFNKDHKLVYHGAIDDNSSGPEDVTRKHLSIAIDETAGGKPVSTDKSRSVGCTIKRLK